MVSQLGFEMLCLGYLARFPRLSSVHRFIAEAAAAEIMRAHTQPTWIVDPLTAPATLCTGEQAHPSFQKRHF